MRDRIEQNSDEVITLEITPEESEKLMSGAIYLERPAGHLEGYFSAALGDRKNQQDSYYVNVENGTNAVGIICDGMGGLQGGELASQTAVQRFVESFEEVRYTESNLYPYFCYKMREIDQAVLSLKDEAGNPLYAGTTLVAVAIREGYLQWISVGDSKIYILRGNEMVSVAKEHNYATYLNDKLMEGNISEEEYAREIRRGAALTSYLGMGNVSLMDGNPDPFPLESGDVVILCSDGLYKALPEQQIFEIIRRNTNNLEAAMYELQEGARMASAHVKQDNTSIVMISYGGF